MSLIVKATEKGLLHKLTSPIGRPFVREVFWFNNAYPELAKLYPEITSISPGKIIGVFINDITKLGEGE